MDTPVCDFVQRYAAGDSLRLHMPGHKGKAFLGLEHLDITEIHGADSLYEAEGIIAQSEDNASRLFGCRTFYSTEGSSQCIRAMLYLALLHAKRQGIPPLIAAARNVHKTFLSAAALLDMDVMWLYPENGDHYLSCQITAGKLDEILTAAAQKPVAVYLTSPDYLGNLMPIAEITAVCRRHGVLLLVDNAHGAYLRFLEKSLHPMDLGADICCDSAHKTLPVLTGGAYLHISSTLPVCIREQAKNALGLFGSTSPSYLILQSLDQANAYLEYYKDRLRSFLPMADKLKTDLSGHGFFLIGQEPLKITIAPKSYGYTGMELAQILRSWDMECEFADPDYLVLMLTPEITATDLQRLETALLSVPQRSPVLQPPPMVRPGKKRLSVREAMLSLGERIPISESKGRILAAASVGCPPAVPILVCGEEIDEDAIHSFRYYGVDHATVVTTK